MHALEVIKARNEEAVQREMLLKSPEDMIREVKELWGRADLLLRTIRDLQKANA